MLSETEARTISVGHYMRSTHSESCKGPSIFDSLIYTRSQILYTPVKVLIYSG